MAAPRDCGLGPFSIVKLDRADGSERQIGVDRVRDVHRNSHRRIPHLVRDGSVSIMIACPTGNSPSCSFLRCA